MTNLPDEDHFIRVATWTKVRKDEDDNPIGILPEAFERRDDEDGLSGNWLERLPGELPDRLAAHLALMRSQRDIGAKARLALINVGNTKARCAEHGSKIRIIHAPVDGNEPHAEIRQLPRDDLVLLSLIADECVIHHEACGAKPA